ncbi:MAG: peptidoglycan-binding protein [Verrucomicrobiae bacterium]|nr:peptidoglycan-binding protein [Verrucomicrobiae bacterium]
MKSLSSIVAAVVCTMAISLGCSAQADSDLVATNKVHVVCHRPYEKYTTKEGEEILAYLSLLGFDDVRSYQRSRGLVVDGVAGHETCRTAIRDLSGRNLFSSSSRLPIAYKLIQTDAGIRLSISNQTDRPVVLLGVGSLISVKGGTCILHLPVTALASGQSTSGALVRRSTQTEVRIAVPSVIEPTAVLERTLHIKAIGSGVTELRARFVAVIGTNRVEMVETDPLRFSQMIEFDE